MSNVAKFDVKMGGDIFVNILSKLTSDILITNINFEFDVRPRVVRCPLTSISPRSYIL